MVNSPFVVTEKKVASGSFDKEYVSFYEKESIADGFDKEHPDEFLIEKKVVEFERIPIKEEINSHRNKVGLKNLLKGIVSSRQMDELVKRTQAVGGFFDATKLPDSHLEMEKLAGSIDKVWNSIPSELKGDLSKEEFIKTLSSEKIKNYILGQVAKEEAAASGKDEK